MELSRKVASRVSVKFSFVQAEGGVCVVAEDVEGGITWSVLKFKEDGTVFLYSDIGSEFFITDDRGHIDVMYEEEEE